MDKRVFIIVMGCENYQKCEVPQHDATYKLENSKNRGVFHSVFNGLRTRNSDI